jgi:hypothetical protein
MNELTFCSVPTNDANGETRENPYEKDWERFPWADKTGPRRLGRLNETFCVYKPP